VQAPGIADSFWALRAQREQAADAWSWEAHCA
jgi:hypothetical protein